MTARARIPEGLVRAVQAGACRRCNGPLFRPAGDVATCCDRCGEEYVHVRAGEDRFFRRSELPSGDALTAELSRLAELAERRRAEKAQVGR